MLICFNFLLFLICLGIYGHIQHLRPQQYPLLIKNSLDSMISLITDYKTIRMNSLKIFEKFITK